VAHQHPVTIRHRLAHDAHRLGASVTFCHSRAPVGLLRASNARPALTCTAWFDTTGSSAGPATSPPSVAAVADLLGSSAAIILTT
jgi:hypothetical protein